MNSQASNIKKINTIEKCIYNNCASLKKPTAQIAHFVFADTLTFAEIKEQLEKENIDIFINVRTDTFILFQENVIEETKKRIQLYQNAGADGIFIPCVEKEIDIKTIVDSTNLPINIMCMPNLPNFDTLTRLGVKRMSMGNFLFDKMYN